MSRMLAAQRALTTPVWIKSDIGRKARALPSLDLRFADSKSLVDATTGANLVTFTRASSGTYVDSQGVIRNATTNLLLRSQAFNDASWTKTGILAFGSGSVADSAIAPDGSLTADKITEDTSAGFHLLSQLYSIASGNTYTFSIYAKAAERDLLQINAGTGFSLSAARYNLQTGAVTIITGSPIASVTYAGDGWHRCTITATATSTTSVGSFPVYLTNGISSSYTGDGTSGLYLWGAQLEQSSSVGEYIPTGATINSAPRFDHNPTTGESLGLLVEEQRTNLLVRSQEFQGSGWIRGGLTVTADQEIAPDGTQTADTCTLTSSGHALYTFVSVAQSTTYTFSFYAKRGTGTTATYAITNDSAGGTSIVANTSYYSQTSSSAWTRITVTFTTPVGCTSIGVILQRDSGSSSGTMLFWGAQLEAGAFPTSYIPTTTSAATRSADVVSISGSSYSSWASNTAFTVFTEAASASGAAYTGYVYTIGADFNNCVMHYRQADYQPVARIRNSGVDEYGATGNGAVWTGTSPNKFALALSTTSGRQASNGSLSTGSDDPSITFPAMSSMTIGALVGNSIQLNGHIRRLTYWPARLSNNVLQELTR